MTGYYDIHTHILPEVDDGAEDMEETGRMLSIAYQEGIRHIVATPHFAMDRENASVRELQERFREVKEAAREIAPGLTLSLGNELLDSEGIVAMLQEKKALTMGGTRYILVEFLPGTSYSKMYASLRNYIMYGYIPIIAHMERYEALFRKPENIRELIKLGVFLQMNTGSLVGSVLKRREAYHRRLLEEGYIHFLGSDCHGAKVRTPIMKSALQYLHRDFTGGDTGKAVLMRNPADMLADKYI